MATASRLLSLLLRTFSPTSPRDNVPTFALGCPCGSAKLSRTTRSAITYVAAAAPAGHRLSPKSAAQARRQSGSGAPFNNIARGMAAQHARSTSKLNLHWSCSNLGQRAVTYHESLVFTSMAVMSIRVCVPGNMVGNFLLRHARSGTFRN